jgi:hypothetical protein
MFEGFLLGVVGTLCLLLVFSMLICGRRILELIDGDA